MEDKQAAKRSGRAGKLRVPSKYKKDVSEISPGQSFRSDSNALMLSLSSEKYILLFILSLTKNNSNDQRFLVILVLMEYSYKKKTFSEKSKAEGTNKPPKPLSECIILSLNNLN